ncbi:MAG: membrane protein insertion efficiency factor YidD [Gammaproteobacteria bacterium]|jgi:uncharacterized protein|nr:membrane protein insertion efficiency factor YidD [Gammaproteobacteria bacterium]
MSSRLDSALCRLIERYQRNGGGSRYFNTDCNFEPTCSEYAKQAILALGSRRSVPVILSRLRRCNDPDKIERVCDPFLERPRV